LIVQPIELAAAVGTPPHGGEPDPRELMRPFPSELMRMWPISTRVNKPENDDPSIVEPSNSQPMSLSAIGPSRAVPENRPANYVRMSDADFTKSVRDQFGFDPGI
jgi:hypothetical protein